MDNITKLKYWTYKILPLVYDDSLSYYEVLSKVAQKINELVDSNNEMPEAITNEITRQLNGDYATDIDDRVQSLITSICKGIATDEGKATFTENPKQGGELIWLNGTLYKVTAVMTAGQNYIVSTNIEEVKISDEIRKVKNEYLEIENEHWNERASRPHAVNTFMFWKDELYRVTNDIKVNDILYDSGNNQNLTKTYFGIEIYNHYNEMHEADNNLQTQIDGNDGDIENLQNGLTTETNRATSRENSIDGRISNIVAQSGNDNTEIVDARKEAGVFGDNVVAPTLGDAIRAQATMNVNFSSGDKPIRCLIPAGQTVGKLYCRQNDRIALVPSDKLTLPITYTSSDTSNTNLYFETKGGRKISYYGVLGNNFKIVTLTPNYFTEKEYYYIELNNPVDYPISALNLTMSMEFQGYGIHNNVRACYISGDVQYQRNNNDISITLPITGYTEGENAGIIGYYPAYSPAAPYSAISATFDKSVNVTFNTSHNICTIILKSGRYLVYNGTIVDSDGVGDCLPLFGNIYGRFLNYTGNIPVDNTPTIHYEENNTTLLTIQRFGEGYGQPESRDSVISALKAGYNGVRLDLQFTADNVPVCWHDTNANQFYHNVYDADGNLVPYTDENKITISTSTVAELDKYKWGGTSYALGIPRLGTSIRPFRPANKILVLEQKVPFTANQCSALATIIRSNGIANKTYIAAISADQADLIHTALPECYVGWAGVSIANNLTEYSDRAEQGYHLFWWAWNTTELTQSQASALSRLGIIFWAGDFSTQDAITTFLNKQCNKYCTGVETTVPLAGTAYFHTIIPEIID